MDAIFLLIAIYLLAEIFFLIRRGWTLPSKNALLIGGAIGLAGVWAMLQMLRTDAVRSQFDIILLPAFGKTMPAWVASLIMLVGLIENVAFVAVGTVRMLKRTKAHDGTDAKRRRAIALEYGVDHDGLTIQDFERLCPGAARESLGQDLNALVELRLLVPEQTADGVVYRLKRKEEGSTGNGADKPQAPAEAKPAAAAAPQPELPVKPSCAYCQLLRRQQGLFDRFKCTVSGKRVDDTLNTCCDSFVLRT